jgi:hypothetical protein
MGELLCFYNFSGVSLSECLDVVCESLQRKDGYGLFMTRDFDGRR